MYDISIPFVCFLLDFTDRKFDNLTTWIKDMHATNSILSYFFHQIVQSKTLQFLSNYLFYFFVGLSMLIHITWALSLYLIDSLLLALNSNWKYFIHDQNKNTFTINIIDYAT